MKISDFNNLKRLSTPRGEVLSIYSDSRLIWRFGSYTLNNNDWETIREISDMGLAESYWAVGDRKEVILNGTCGDLTFNNEAYWCFIIGFDHNSEYEGTNRIHFQFGFKTKTSESPIAFVSNYWSIGSGFCINLDLTNENGWAGSHMRNTTCPQFKACLPTDMQAAIKTVVKWTDNVGGNSDIASNVTATTEEIFLLSEYEVFGYQDLANNAEQEYQQEYPFYKTTAELYRDGHTGEHTYVSWALRSPDMTGAISYRGQRFCAADYYGCEALDANFSEGFSPAFCV